MEEIRYPFGLEARRGKSYYNLMIIKAQAKTCLYECFRTRESNPAYSHYMLNQAAYWTRRAIHIAMFQKGLRSAKPPSII